MSKINLNDPKTDETKQPVTSLSVLPISRILCVAYTNLLSDSYLDQLNANELEPHAAGLFLHLRILLMVYTPREY